MCVYVYIYIYIYIYIYNPSRTSLMQRKNIFHLSFTGYNSKLTSSDTSCYAKVKNPVCPTIYP